MRIELIASTLAALLAAGLAPDDASATELIANGGFEAPATASAPGSYGSYAYPEGTLGGWTFQGAGLIDAVSATPWFGGNPPQGYAGQQYGFVQSTGTLSQVFTADVAGVLALSWLEGSRPFMYGGCCNGDQSYEVWLDTTLLGSFSTASGQDFLARSLDGPVLTAGSSYTLRFKGLSTGDNTVFLDNVSASITPTGAVPEPASWALFIAGFGLVGLAARRRVPAAP
jgi:hypothetical protein